MPGLKRPPCQEILDAQGFLVISSRGRYVIPTVLEGINAGYGYARIPGPLVVVANATKQEWEVQRDRFSIIKGFGTKRKFFYKVMAE